MKVKSIAKISVTRQAKVWADSYCLPATVYLVSKSLKFRTVIWRRVDLGVDLSHELLVNCVYLVWQLPCRVFTLKACLKWLFIAPSRHW